MVPFLQAALTAKRREWARGLAGLSLILLLGICTPLLAAEKSSVAELTPSDEVREVLDKSYPKSVADLKLIEQQVRRVVKLVTPCTVGVRVGSSQGSGVIISEDGYVLTAGHVAMKPGLNAVFILHDGREVKGKTLGINHDIDSGLMKISDKGPWPFIKMADPDQLKTGQWCVAAGHPGGYVKNRQPVVRLGRILFKNKKVICTDCTLVGGDSGGPLFDMLGRVIGIHSRIGWQLTTNFHVPISTYQNTWDRLVSAEMWGDAGRSADGNVKPLVGMAGNPTGDACHVAQVFPNSPAARAGLKVGDVVKKFDGKPVANFTELAEAVAKKKPGQRIGLEILRGEEKLSLRLVLGRRYQPLPGGPGDK